MLPIPHRQQNTGLLSLSKVLSLNWVTQWFQLQADWPLSDAMPVRAKAGDVLIFSYLLVHGDYPLLKSMSLVVIPMSTHQIYSILHRQLPKLVGQNTQNVLDPGRAHITHDSSKVALLLLRNWCWSKMLMPMHWWLAAPNLPCWCSYLAHLKICNADVVVRISHSSKSATPMLILGGKRRGPSSELSSPISRRWTGRNHVDF